MFMVPQGMYLMMPPPAAEAYLHDAAGDDSDAAAPAAVAYVHDVTGDVSDDSTPSAKAYVHETGGDA
jgi:hypothetical protein